MSVLLTTGMNMLGLVGVTVAGVVVARGLGQSGRGHYAVIVAWYGVGLVVGEVGQGAALTFFNSRNPSAVAANVRRSRRIMVIASGAAALIGILLAPLLAGGDGGAVWAYRLMFIGLPVNGAFAAHLFSFQATELVTWNLLRTIQPLVNLALLVPLALLERVSLVNATTCLIVSATSQLLVGSLVFHRRHAGSDDLLDSPSPLLSFGVKQAGSAVPSMISTYLDRLYLSQSVPSSRLGDYAVAQSVLSAASSLGNGIASVVFPNFAGRSGVGRRAAEWRVVIGAIVVVVPFVSILTMASPWLIPLVFGSAFASSVGLSMWLAPAVIAQNLVVVMGALLRGRGVPGRAGIANVLALVGSASAMVVTVPRFGVVGAPIGSLFGSLLAIVMQSLVLSRRPAGLAGL